LQGGVVYWSARTGAHDVRGAILERWRSLGAQTGVLGYPVGDDVAVPGGWKTDFAGGSIYWSPSTGARMVRGAILQRYVAAGGPASLGFPVADDGPTPDGKGAFIRLERAEIHWSPSTGANLVSGAVLERWRAVGGQTGSLGAPTGAEVCGGSECIQHFRGGAIYNQVYGNASGWTGTLVVSGPVAQKWFADGAENGHLGYPANEQRCDLPGGSCAQPFADGWLVTSTPGPARWLSFIGYRGWQENGGAAGRLGHPGNDCRPWGSELSQYCNFEHGVLFVNLSTDNYWIDYHDNA
jgi:uncharacterized protein with LGFP repeats